MNEADALIVFGNWRLRHAEPLPEQARRLRVLRMPLRTGTRAAQGDCRGEHPLVAHCVDGQWQPQGDGVQRLLQSHNVDPDWVPLAHVAMADGQLRIRHLVDRADRHVAHFIEPPVAMPPFAPPLLCERLAEAFQANHLQTNNYECFYTELERPESLNLRIEAQGLDVLALGDAWLEYLGSAEEQNFVARIGEELQHVGHDNLLCEVLPHLAGARGWVNAAAFSRKRRATVLEPLAELTAAVEHDGAWASRTLVDQPVGVAMEIDLAQHFDLPLRPLLRWRQVQMASGCESLATGHLFSVAFSSSQPLASNDAAPVLHCAIDYLRTRGAGTAAEVLREQSELGERVLRFLRRQGLDAVVSDLRGPAFSYQRLAMEMEVHG